MTALDERQQNKSLRAVIQLFEQNVIWIKYETFSKNKIASRWHALDNKSDSHIVEPSNTIVY